MTEPYMTKVQKSHLTHNGQASSEAGSRTIRKVQFPDLTHSTKPATAARPRHVILESPFAGDVVGNVAYARRAIADSLSRGEAPLASHLLYTQPGVLDDTIPGERRLGINAGLSWYDFAKAAVVYVDRGISSGMEQGIDLARALGVDVEYRTIGDVELTRWQRLRARIAGCLS